MSHIPNRFPLTATTFRLAIVGEAPNHHDFASGRPFSGTGGNLLTGALNAFKIPISSCFLGYVCQSMPPNGDIENFDKGGPEITEGLAQLARDLNSFQPNCTLYLGATALWAAGSFHKLHLFRGSLFRDRHGRKAIATFAPGYINKVWDDSPLFQFDIGRAVSEASSPELILPQRTLRGNMTASEVLTRLAQINNAAEKYSAAAALKPDGSYNVISTGVPLVSVDIEGGVPDPTATTHKHLDGVTCIGISTDPLDAFIIPVQDFDDATKLVVMREFAKMMSNPRISKVLQNSLYDYTVLAWLWKIDTKNVRHDTMLSGWEIYPELPKGLGTQASIWTREPYYKFERTAMDTGDGRDPKTIHYEYCCKDAAVTLEIHQNHMAAMTPKQKEHYEFNMSLIPSLQFMSLRGIRYDQAASDQKKAEVHSKMLSLQMACNTHAGCEINLNSPKQMTDLLYRKLGFEPQYKMEKGRKTNKLTADADAMLNLVVKAKSAVHPFLSCALAWKKLEGVRKQLEITTDHDGRVRCSYNLVGAETGRLSCSGSVTGSGTNLQTIMEENRSFYVADPGHYFFQCDLAGADGWTVAAHASTLGDPTMIEDYYANLKPAKIIALMHVVGPHVNDLPRSELKALLKTTDIPDHIYAICKVVQHGSSYGMGPNRMSKNLLEKSFKKSADSTILSVPPADCKRIQALFFKRYPGVLAWQRWVEQQLQRGHMLDCASGHIRTFFGRPGDDQMLKAALAHEPQANTTYATNLAMQKLWLDPENRDSSGALIIQPLHSVHDALCGQFPISRTEWAVGKIRSYFNNTIRIGNEQILIPFEGGYGPSWYDTKGKLAVGEI